MKRDNESIYSIEIKNLYIVCRFLDVWQIQRLEGTTPSPPRLNEDNASIT